MNQENLFVLILHTGDHLPSQGVIVAPKKRRKQKFYYNILYNYNVFFFFFIVIVFCYCDHYRCISNIQ